MMKIFLSVQHFVNSKLQTYSQKKQYSGSRLPTQEGNAYSEFLDIDSETNKTRLTSQFYLNEAPFE